MSIASNKEKRIEAAQQTPAQAGFFTSKETVAAWILAESMQASIVVAESILQIELHDKERR